ncbi:DUF4349 domain-containing protein [Dactylosporangium roseum]|uniref:DUF4349 domain-containing protein n=1 Tax=Dactylosporangium roseum TaxID=47989 RepID=A0ABY5Z9T3_9ACTN|nr:DUF4349 domain-containing protein [Dactylosporangium roseum]UWZ37572.1 DUF4349 domain-containing protein [Dactylosporangium roseum]
MSVRRTTLFLTAACAAVLMALSGCGADSRDDASSSGAAPPAAAPAQQGGAGPQQDKPAEGADSQAKVPDNLDVENRSIIYAGTMTVRVKDVDTAAAQAIAFATGAGGFVGGDNRRHDDRRSQGTLTLRVPAAKFTTTLDQLKSLGDEESRQITAQDVTDQVVDVEARLRTAQASVDRIRALLAKAQTISEITSLESELSRREADLESLQARKRRLDGLTALSTITLVLLGPEAAVDKEDLGIGVGLENGWSAFVTSLRVALTALGWLLPWLVLVGGPVYLLIWLLRRFRPKRPALAGAGGPAMPHAGLPVPPPGSPVPPGRIPPGSPVPPGRVPPPFPGGRPGAGGPVPPPVGGPAFPVSGPIPVPPQGGAGPLSAPPSVAPSPSVSAPVSGAGAAAVPEAGEAGGSEPTAEGRREAAGTTRSAGPPADAEPADQQHPRGPAEDR